MPSDYPFLREVFPPPVLSWRKEMRMVSFNNDQLDIVTVLRYTYTVILFWWFRRLSILFPCGQLTVSLSAQVYIYQVISDKKVRSADIPIIDLHPTGQWNNCFPSRKSVVLLVYLQAYSNSDFFNLSGLALPPSLFCVESFPNMLFSAIFPRKKWSNTGTWFSEPIRNAVQKF